VGGFSPESRRHFLFVFSFLFFFLFLVFLMFSEIQFKYELNNKNFKLYATPKVQHEMLEYVYLFH
jgi:hypothetical protein